MQRILASLVLLAALGIAHAQTIKITTSSGSCTYPTGTVTSDPATPGQLLATATSAPTGTGCPSTTTGAASPPTFGPTQFLAPATTTLSNSGGMVAFSFQAVYANTACTGAITGATGAAFLGTGGNTLCTTTGCGGLVNASASFPANSSTTTDNVYNVKVTCTGNGGSTDSNVATVTVSHSSQVTSTCPVIPSANSVVANFSQWSGPQRIYLDAGLSTSKTADVTKYDQVFGTWPGTQYGQIIYFELPTANYLSMSFTVPNNYMTAPNAPNPLNGAYTVGETGNSTSQSYTISRGCGDFSNPTTYPGTSTVVPGCWKNKALTGGIGAAWSASGSSCVLQNNVTYYLNIVNADISQVQPNGGGTAASTKSTANSLYPCTSATCQVPVKNSPGTWSGYTPQ